MPRLTENRMQANDPTSRTPEPNVSATNATPTDSQGVWDAPLREEPEAGERNRQLQAPNRATTWAASQQPREKAMTGPRFEQTIMELQVCSELSGRNSFDYQRMECIANMDSSSLNPWPPSNLFTSSPCAGPTRESSAVTVAAAHWVTPVSSSTLTSPRSPPAATAVFLS